MAHLTSLRRVPLPAPACPAIDRQNAYELPFLPDEVTIVRVGHPLLGQRLRVDRAAGEHRKDRCIVVALPDGSPTLIPFDWTDAGVKATPAAIAKRSTRIDASGLRRLMRLADAMSARGREDGSP
jgi:hypothetical protein